jgi:hypothetical protein
VYRGAINGLGDFTDPVTRNNGDLWVVNLNITDPYTSQPLTAYSWYAWDAFTGLWDYVGTSLTTLLGATGLQGTTGALGLTGAPGVTGLRGYTGLVGATGALGNTGLMGATGTPGPAGSGVALSTRSISLPSSSYVQLIALGPQSDLNAVTATLSGYGTSSVTLALTSVAPGLGFMSISFFAASSVFSGSSTLTLSLPETMGALGLSTSVFPVLLWYNASGVVQPTTNITISNSGGTLSVQKTSITGGQNFYFAYKIL